MASLEHAGIEADEASSASTGGAPEQPSTEEITEPPKKRKMPHTVEEKIKAAQVLERSVRLRPLTSYVYGPSTSDSFVCLPTAGL